ncbi:MAG: hypothetical protein R3F59_23185 [Myxococcota bacterium]
MASRRDAKARAEAVQKLLDALGTDAPERWGTLGELFQRAEVPLGKPTVTSLARKAAVLVRNVRARSLAELEAVHVAPLPLAADAVASDEVLVGILRRLAITLKSRAHTVTELANTVPDRDKPALRKALDERARERRWPPGVGAVRGPKGPLVFLLQDLAVGAATEPEGFAPAFDRAFERLRDQRGLNLVALSALRAALSRFPRDAFDRELNALRRADQVVLHTFDGRHGKLSPADEAAAIEEGGRRFVYAARRDA